jgi:SEC-C motif domain protein
MRCPCGRTGSFGPLEYEACCGRYLDQAEAAPDVESLMRSRYTAFALDRPDHIIATWHVSSRPRQISVDARTWVGLDVLDVGEDQVEFVARYRLGGAVGEIHERSRFVLDDGRWVYVDGDML